MYPSMNKSEDTVRSSLINIMEYITLANGNIMPKVGLGTDDVFFLHKFQYRKNPVIRKLLSIFHYRIMGYIWKKQFENSVVEALRMGYRLIDTSAAYGNEKEIGNAIRRSGIPREEIIITTRVSNRNQFDGKVRESFMQSLKNLNVEYIDLYMFHWPVTDHYLDTWREMEKLYHEGLVKSLGFANCHKHHIEDILKICTVKPVVNQIEIHPLLSQKPLIEYCKYVGIQPEAYSPIAQNDDRMMRNRTLHALAKKYNKSLQQIIIRWHIENRVIPIPRSIHKDRLFSNMNVFDFTLTNDEIKAIDAININARKRYDPDNCDFTLL